MSFNEQPYRTRYYKMGDEAEQVFEEAHPLGAVARYGWDRPEGIQMKWMPVNLRHQPDYYAEAGYLVEVMGLGRDGIMKGLKLPKWEAYKIWKKISRLLGLQDLMTFIWNSHTEQYALLSYEQLKGLAAKGRKRGIEAFNDGNEYIPILWEWIEETAGRVVPWHVDR